MKRLTYHNKMRKFTSLNIVLILWFAGLCSAAQFAKIAHIIPELEVIYPHAGSSLGFLLSLISLVGACLGLMAGLLVSYIGPRKILIIGLASGTLISLLQSVSLPLDIFLISRAFEGASHLAIVVAAPTYTRRTQHFLGLNRYNLYTPSTKIHGLHLPSLLLLQVGYSIPLPLSLYYQYYQRYYRPNNALLLQPHFLLLALLHQ